MVGLLVCSASVFVFLQVPSVIVYLQVCIDLTPLEYNRDWNLNSSMVHKKKRELLNRIGEQYEQQVYMIVYQSVSVSGFVFLAVFFHEKLMLSNSFLQIAVLGGSLLGTFLSEKVN